MIMVPMGPVRWLAAIVLLAMPLLAWPGYDPLAIDKSAVVRGEDFTFDDAKRKRAVPVRIFWPAKKEPAPVVLFSHGLGGSREGNAFMGEHWAARGYVAVFVQHPGSDSAVWQDAPAATRGQALKRAASVQNLRLRVEDVRFVLDELARRSGKDGSFKNRIDLDRIGMSGHSFGAITTQAVSGQQFPMGLGATEARIRAAIAFSPSSPRRGDAKAAFAKVAIPWLLMTGTDDSAPIGDIDAAARLEVFPALPAGRKYELVLDKAEHSAFTDRALPGDKEARNPNHHRAVLAISTAFWDAWLRDDAAARAWLDGDGPKAVLQPADRWQRK